VELGTGKVGQGPEGGSQEERQVLRASPIVFFILEGGAVLGRFLTELMPELLSSQVNVNCFEDFNHFRTNLWKTVKYWRDALRVVSASPFAFEDGRLYLLCFARCGSRDIGGQIIQPAAQKGHQGKGNGKTLRGFLSRFGASRRIVAECSRFIVSWGFLASNTFFTTSVKKASSLQQFVDELGFRILFIESPLIMKVLSLIRFFHLVVSMLKVEKQTCAQSTVCILSRSLCRRSYGWFQMYELFILPLSLTE
jgi:hypothetical protein